MQIINLIVIFFVSSMRAWLWNLLGPIILSLVKKNGDRVSVTNGKCCFFHSESGRTVAAISCYSDWSTRGQTSLAADFQALLIKIRLTTFKSENVRSLAYKTIWLFLLYVDIKPSKTIKHRHFWNLWADWNKAKSVTSSEFIGHRHFFLSVWNNNFLICIDGIADACHTIGWF